MQPFTRAWFSLAGQSLLGRASRPGKPLVVDYVVAGAPLHSQHFENRQLVSWTQPTATPDLEVWHETAEQSWAFCAGSASGEELVQSTLVATHGGLPHHPPPMDTIQDVGFGSVQATMNMSILWQQNLRTTPFGDLSYYSHWQDGQRIAAGLGSHRNAEVVITLRYREAMLVRNGSLAPNDALRLRGTARGEITLLMMLSGFVQKAEIQALWGPTSLIGPLLGRLGIAFAQPAYRSLLTKLRP